MKVPPKFSFEALHFLLKYSDVINNEIRRKITGMSLVSISILTNEEVSLETNTVIMKCIEKCYHQLN